MAASDTFTRANGTLDGSTTETGGFTWTPFNGTGWTVASNKAVGVSGGRAIAFDFGATDQDVQADVGLNSGQAHVLARGTTGAESGSYLLAGFQPGGATTLTLYEMTNTGYTVRGTYAAGVHSGTVRLVVLGDDVKVYLDGTLRITYTITSANYRTGTWVGLYTSSAGSFDNFSVTGSNTTNVDTPGAITWTGQSVATVISTRISPGAIVWAGQTIVIVSTQSAGGYTGEAGLPRFPGDNVDQKRLLRWP